jgi:hypothetical protein
VDHEIGEIRKMETKLAEVNQPLPAKTQQRLAELHRQMNVFGQTGRLDVSSGTGRQIVDPFAANAGGDVPATPPDPLDVTPAGFDQPPAVREPKTRGMMERERVLRTKDLRDKAEREKKFGGNVL